MEEITYSNENPQANRNTNQPFVQVPLPNSTGVLVLGILSIVLCFCYGIVGLILGIIALILSSKANALYKANPEAYTLSSFNNLKAGKICGIIGLILSALYIIVVIIYLVVLGAALTAMPWSQMMNH
jgi:hypothetical protein